MKLRQTPMSAAHKAVSKNRNLIDIRRRRAIQESLFLTALSLLIDSFDTI